MALLDYRGRESADLAVFKAQWRKAFKSVPSDDDLRRTMLSWWPRYSMAMTKEAMEMVSGHFAGTGSITAITELCATVLDKLREQEQAEQEAKLAALQEQKKLVAWKKANAVALKAQAEAAEAKAELMEKQFRASEKWTVASLDTTRRIKEL